VVQCAGRHTLGELPGFARRNADAPAGTAVHYEGIKTFLGARTEGSTVGALIARLGCPPKLVFFRSLSDGPGDAPQSFPLVGFRIR